MCRIYFYGNEILWVFKLVKILVLTFGFGAWGNKKALNLYFQGL